MGLAASLARTVMKTQRALQKAESVFRHDSERRERSSARSLAIATVAVKHQHGLGCAFVANRATGASTGKGRVFYRSHRYSLSFHEQSRRHGTFLQCR